MTALTVALLVLGACLPAANAATQASAQTAQNVPSSVSGKITALDADALSPSMTVTDDSGKDFTILINSATTTVTIKGGAGHPSDLKLGQQVQITGRHMMFGGSFAAKSIAVTQESPAPAPPPSAAPAPAPAPASSADTKSKSLPRVLKSGPSSEQRKP